MKTESPESKSLWTLIPISISGAIIGFVCHPVDSIPLGLSTKERDAFFLNLKFHDLFTGLVVAILVYTFQRLIKLENYIPSFALAGLRGASVVAIININYTKNFNLIDCMGDALSGFLFSMLIYPLEIYFVKLFSKPKTKLKDTIPPDSSA